MHTNNFKNNSLPLKKKNKSPCKINIKDETLFPELSSTNLQINKENNDESVNQYSDAIKKEKYDLKSQNKKKTGWVYLTQMSQDFPGRDQETEHKISMGQVIQKLVNRWQKEKEEYISVYGMEDYISVHGNYEYISDEEEEYEDYDVYQEDYYDTFEY
jgi:hypothetical protein